MQDQAVKIQQSTMLIKGFMALVVVFEAFQMYQTNVMDWGALAGVFAALSLLRGLLLSPTLLATPLKHWFKSNNILSRQSYKYFLLALVLLIVSAF